MINQNRIELLKAEVKHLTYITSSLDTKIKKIEKTNKILLRIIGTLVFGFLLTIIGTLVFWFLLR